MGAKRNTTAARTVLARNATPAQPARASKRRHQDFFLPEDFFATVLPPRPFQRGRARSVNASLGILRRVPAEPPRLARQGSCFFLQGHQLARCASPKASGEGRLLLLLARLSTQRITVETEKDGPKSMVSWIVRGWPSFPAVEASARAVPVVTALSRTQGCNPSSALSEELIRFAEF